jgi:hypothetical protein
MSTTTWCGHAAALEKRVAELEARLKDTTPEPPAPSPEGEAYPGIVVCEEQDEGFGPPSDPWTVCLEWGEDECECVGTFPTEIEAQACAKAIHDSLTAPLRTECEHLRAEADLQKKSADKFWKAWHSQASRADAAEEERDALRERVRELEAERDEYKEALWARMKQEVNARRTTIEELAEAARGMRVYSPLHVFVSDWLRAKLDTPTEQPTPDAPKRPARFRDPTWCPDCDDEAMIDDSDGGICQGCGTMTAADKRDALAEARKQERERCAKVADDACIDATRKQTAAFQGFERERQRAFSEMAAAIAHRIRALPDTPEPTPEGTEP